MQELRDDHASWKPIFGASGSQGNAVRGPDRDNLKRYAEANSRMTAPQQAGASGFPGDSITDFWRLNEYFADRDFVKRGISARSPANAGPDEADVIDLKPASCGFFPGPTHRPRRAVSHHPEQPHHDCDLAQLYKISPFFASICP